MYGTPFSFFNLRLASFNTALLEGGAMAMFWGWIVAPPFILILGLCIAEACSAYPVNGSIYSCRFLVIPHPLYLPTDTFLLFLLPGCYILTSKQWAPFCFVGGQLPIAHRQHHGRGRNLVQHEQLHPQPGAGVPGPNHQFHGCPRRHLRSHLHHIVFAIILRP